MLLTDKEIIAGLAAGELTISPFKEKFLKPAAYTLTLGDKVYRIKTDKVIDINEGLESGTLEEELIYDKGIIIEPGEFLLAKSAEKVGVGRSLAAMLDGRTSLARIGLNLLHGNSSVINPGQEPVNQTLEVHNASANSIRIYAGMKAVKVVFFRLGGESDQDYSRMAEYGKSREDDVVPAFGKSRSDESLIKLKEK